MEENSDYICLKSFSWITKDKEERFFKKNECYNFYESNDAFIFTGDKKCHIYKSNFKELFVLAESIENKGLNEDSRNIIKGANQNFQSDLELEFDLEVQSTLQKFHIYKNNQFAQLTIIQ